jgi:hypothetical protein
MSGKKNLDADFLSIIQNGSKSDLVDDSFLDDHLFAIYTNSPWFPDIANYLATRKFPQQQIAKLGANYSWIRGDLFHTGPYLIIRICVREDDMFNIFRDFHDGTCGDQENLQSTSSGVLLANTLQGCYNICKELL